MKLDSHGQPPPSLNRLQNTRKAISELGGLIKGMLADRHLSSDEITFLANWLSRHLDILDEWPVTEVAQRVARVLDDGEITEGEARELAAFLDSIVGGDAEDGSGIPRATRAPCDDAHPIIFQGRSFCFTGKFQYGERKRCQSCSEALGAVIRKDVTLDLDYLVIGTLVSRDWAQTNHGRKIEAAVRNRQRGAKTTVVSEAHWLTCLACEQSRS